MVSAEKPHNYYKTTWSYLSVKESIAAEIESSSNYINSCQSDFLKNSKAFFFTIM